MTEQQLRQKVVDTAIGFYGLKVSDGSHRQIIDYYNANPPLARGYKMSYTDAWCACFVSVVAIKAGTLVIMPKEVGCNNMIELYKGLGRWEENDAHTPRMGDVIFYDWQDSGVGDNTGSADHVGIVVTVSSGTIKVIEGNISNAVGYRSVAVNGKCIRGYGLPDFAKAAGGASPTTPSLPAPAAAPIDETIWAFLTGKGLNAYAAAGVMGNLFAESALNPRNLQNTYEKRLCFTDDTYTAAVDNGTYTNFVRDCAGYGLVQWTYWSRKQALLDFAKAAGTSIGDLIMQLNFLLKELQSYPDVMAVLKAATSVRQVSDKVLLQYERPADTSAAVQVKRAEYGQRYYEKFAGKTTAPALSTPAALSMSFKVGDIVQFVGGGVYVSAGAAQATQTRPASRCKVTQTYSGKHPYHLISEDGKGVCGWVDASNVTASGTSPALASSTPATPPVSVKTGVKVQFTGGSVYTSANAATAATTKPASRCKVTQTYSGKHPYHLISEDGKGVHGWVDAANVTK